MYVNTKICSWEYIEGQYNVSANIGWSWVWLNSIKGCETEGRSILTSPQHTHTHTNKQTNKQTDTRFRPCFHFCHIAKDRHTGG